MEQKELLPDEAMLLRTIYTKRTQLFIGTLLLFYFIIMFATAKGLMSEPGFARYAALGFSDFPWSKFPTEVIFFCVCMVAFSVTMFITYRRAIGPFSKDAKNGFKVAVPFNITRMEYFPITNQYFIGCDNPKYPFHEVDQADYSKCNVGDTVYLYQAPLSKYYFEKDGRFLAL